MRTLTRLLREGVGRLEPAEHALIHGDLAAGQFQYSGDRLILLDFDTASLADPAYDVGHFLGQLERRCMLDASLPTDARAWLSCFRDAYAAESPNISWRNVSFYQGLTLVRKMATLSRRDPIRGAGLAARLARSAQSALEASLKAQDEAHAVLVPDRRNA